MSTVPALFVSHGAPLFIVEPGVSGPALRAWGEPLQDKLRGVVVMSPHWMARSPVVMSNPQPPTWHDFGGFPEELYRLQYPAPGSPGLAAEVAALLEAAGMPTALDPARPLDHGTWVPLMHLLPAAKVPVVQVALPAGWDARRIYAMGEALQSLRKSGVLIMGSGSMTHNLAEFFGGARAPAPYVEQFSRWVEEKIVQGDMEALFNHRSQAPNAHRAHPTDDHFLPLFFALGAGGPGAKPDYLTREVMYSMLAMDSFSLT